MMIACEYPKVVFVSGAVGSGNTIMFKCLARDSHVYGINEDDLVDLLGRLVASEQEMGACPHSIDAFVTFLDLLRADRQSLILKTPSNFRRHDLIKKHVPGARFVIMVREPRAAIVSGLARHLLSATEVAKIWKSDYELISTLKSDHLLVPYEHLVARPVETLKAVSRAILPLEEEVFTFASRICDAARTRPDRWREKVDPVRAAEIEQLVDDLGLDEFHRSLLASPRNLSGLGPDERFDADAPFQRKISTVRNLFFRAWYKIRNGQRR